MNDRYRRETEMFQRAYMFLDENKEDFTTIPIIASITSGLQAELQVLSDLGAEKISVTVGAKDTTLYKGDLRDNLKEAMQNIADMWKPMAKNHENAQNKFRMPRGSDQLLIDTAGSFIEDAEPLEQDFINRGMPIDFIADLTAKRAAFDAVVNESAAAKLERVGVNAQFVEPIKKCRAYVEDADPIVKMAYRDNPGKTAEWISATHVERAAKRSKPSSSNNGQ